MTDIEMLPLPECFSFMDWREQLQDYARAVAEHNVKALRAEVETLRMGVCGDACLHIAIERDQLKARAERLAEALRDARDYVTTALREEREKFSGHEDCSDIPGIEADLHKIDALLRDHDQEGK